MVRADWKTLTGKLCMGLGYTTKQRLFMHFNLILAHHRLFQIHSKWPCCCENIDCHVLALVTSVSLHVHRFSNLNDQSEWSLLPTQHSESALKLPMGD